MYGYVRYHREGRKTLWVFEKLVYSSYFDRCKRVITNICNIFAHSHPVSSIKIWSRNFSHLANVKAEPKMAEIEGAIGGLSSPPTCAAKFFGLIPVFLSGK